jgi:hypothetical protein
LSASDISNLPGLVQNIVTFFNNTGVEDTAFTGESDSSGSVVEEVFSDPSDAFDSSLDTVSIIVEPDGGGGSGIFGTSKRAAEEASIAAIEGNPAIQFGGGSTVMTNIPSTGVDIATRILDGGSEMSPSALQAAEVAEGVQLIQDVEHAYPALGAS